MIAGVSNSNLKLFKRGSLKSAELVISGSIQFPKPPNVSGITKEDHEDCM